MEVKCVYNECKKVAFRSSCHTLVLSLMQSIFWHLGVAVTKVYYSCSLPHLTCWCLLASISCGSCSSQTFFSLCNYVLRRTTGVVHIADLGYPWPHTFISPEKSVCSSIGGAIARVPGLRLFVLLLASTASVSIGAGFITGCRGLFCKGLEVIKVQRRKGLPISEYGCSSTQWAFSWFLFQ